MPREKGQSTYSLNGRKYRLLPPTYLNGAEMFSLYCTEIGKPRAIVCWFQSRGWIDLTVLQWEQGRDHRLPSYLSTIFPDFNDPNEGEYGN